ncbi:NupC/NupG family nucleoside CNT transporter [Georgenia subflava]
MHVLWGLGGMVFVLAVAVLFSVDRRKIRLRTVGLALAIQVVFAVLVLYIPAGRAVLETVSKGVQEVINTSRAGIDFLFGPILPEEGSVFAFQVLPVIVFFAALTAVLYHLGVLQWVVKIIGGGLAKLLGTTESESMNAAANIFVGQTEAPLVIRPYIAGMSRSELFAVMAGGLTTVAGSVLVGYALLGAELDYLIAASFMAAPAALLMAKILVPAGSLEESPAAATENPAAEAQNPAAVAQNPAAARENPAAVAVAPGAASAEQPELTRPGVRAWLLNGGRRGASSAATAELARRGGPGSAVETDEDEDDDGPTNVIDAAAQGASDGLQLALNVGAMLLAFISLIALGNLILGAVGGIFGLDVTIEQILGYVFAPVMFIVGVPWAEAVDAGSFLGQKVILNEFVAFADFAPQAGDFSDKAQAVITFALTGFANLGSLAILLGGLGGIAPDRRSDIARLGMRAVLAGTLGNLMSAAIAGVLIG